MGAAVFMPVKWRNWGFQTDPQPGLGGRRGYQPRGRLLGGSSSMNAMSYARCHASDYDDCATLNGPTGSDLSEVLPSFGRADHHARMGDEVGRTYCRVDVWG